MSTESIKSKIAALLAKAESTDNAFEAETFMAKVNELLEKHQIEMHEVRASTGDRDPLGDQKGDSNIYASMNWAKNVAGSLARYYGCRTIWTKKGNHFHYQVFGRESARVTFELMVPFVISQVRQAAKRLAASEGVTRSRAEGDIGRALWVRIHAMIPKQDERRASLASTALVPVDDVEALVRAAYPEMKKGRTQKVKYTGAAREAADRISLHHQATGKHTKLIGA